MVVFDTYSDPVGYGASVLAANSVSATLTIGSGSNRLVIVTAIWSSATATVDACTFDGIDILSNSIGTATQTTIGFRIQHFFMVNPGSGSKTASVSLTGNVSSLWVIAHSYSDADQTTPTDGFVATQGDASQPASNPVTSAVGDLVVDSIVVQAVTTLAGSGTQMWSDQTSSGSVDVEGQYSTGAASVSPSYTTDLSRNWAIAAFNINAAAAPAETPARIIIRNRLWT